MVNSKFQITWVRVMIALVVVLGITFFMSSCNTIDAGNVGLIIHRAGDARGSIDVQQPGYCMMNPFTDKFVEYPTNLQRVIWTKSHQEGSENNDEITFMTADNMLVHADVTVSYRILPDSAARFYANYRISDLQIFTQSFLRDAVRKQITETMSQYRVDSIMGSARPGIDKQILVGLHNKMLKHGVYVEDFGFPTSPRPPKNIVTAINAKIEATQLAERERNEIAIAENRAAKTIAEARGDSTVRVIRAESESQANKILAQSITPELIQYQQIRIWMEKWNGKLPSTILGGSNTMIQVPIPTN